MKLLLHYRGPLKANGKPDHKHDIRRVFHKQLAKLWSQSPLSEEASYVLKPRQGTDYSLLRPLADFTFVPLVSQEMSVIAEISMLLMRPKAPGGLITQGGDMDNRLKTLFDALTMPRHLNALPPGGVPLPDEAPFYCLLEDDNLITRLDIRTEQLLEPGVDPNTVDLAIQIRTRVTRATMGNSNFA